MLAFQDKEQDVRLLVHIGGSTVNALLTMLHLPSCLSIEDVRHHVNGMGELGTDFTLGLDPLRPVHQERIGDAAAIGFPLPSPKRGIAGMGRAPQSAGPRS